MSEPYLGEIRMFGGNFAPLGWALCAGQLLPTKTNTALFQLLGTQFGGDGVTTFGVPNLIGRVPMAAGSGPGLTPRVVGETGGVDTVALTVDQLPSHGHSFSVSTDAATSTTAAGGIPAVPTETLYAASPPSTFASTTMVQSAGASAPHENRQPFLGINFIIATTGIYPTPH